MPLHAERSWPPSELEALLHDQGCPVCSRRGSGAQLLFVVEIDSLSKVEVQAQRVAVGMCAVHTRRLIEQLGEGHIMTTVARQAVAGPQACLDGELSPAPCPACATTGFAAERGIELLVDGLLDRAQVRLYAEHSGVCLPHRLRGALINRSHPIADAELISHSLTGISSAPVSIGAPQRVSRRVAVGAASATQRQRPRTSRSCALRGLLP